MTFLESIKDKESVEYKSVLPDITVWRNKMSRNDSYVTQYFRYPEFKTYPVVGISHENALLYYKWLEESINSQIVGNKKVVIKLPSEVEWIKAARGDNKDAIYPWEKA